MPIHSSHSSSKIRSKVGLFKVHRSGLGSWLAAARSTVPSTRHGCAYVGVACSKRNFISMLSPLPMLSQISAELTFKKTLLSFPMDSPDHDARVPQRLTIASTSCRLSSVRFPRPYCHIQPCAWEVENPAISVNLTRLRVSRIMSTHGFLMVLYRIIKGLEPFDISVRLPHPNEY